MDLSRLTPAQRSAATSAACRVVIVACAGSGKTTTLAARCALIGAATAGVPGERARAVTFTRAAARELQERAPSAKASTLHGLAVELRRLADNVPFSVYDEVDARDTFIMAAERVGGLKPGGWKDPWAAAEKAGKHAPSAREYAQIMAAARAYDYDQLIDAGVRVAELPHVRAAFAETHLLLDEQQDTDRRQWEIVQRLQPRAITMVGDPQQSIYSFRNADPSILTGALRDATTMLGGDVVQEGSNGWEAHALTTNFRSLPRVVEAANLISSRMDVYLPMTAARSDGPGVVRALADDGETAARTARAAAEGWQPGEPARVMVLARRWRDLESVTERLGDLAGSLGKKPGWREDRDCRMVLRAASLVLNPRQDHWARMLATWRGVSLVDVTAAEALALRSRRPLVSVLGEAIGLPTPWLQGVPASYALRALRLSLGRPDEMTANEVAMFAAIGTWEDDIWAQGLTAYDCCVRAWLESLADGGEVAARPDKPVLLSTVHGAKGLEADLVIVVGADTEGLPNTQDEHRRLAYVAVTRARDELLLTWPRVRVGRGAPKAFDRSDFVREAMPSTATDEGDLPW